MYVDVKIKIDESIAIKVLEAVDAGLVKGLGRPELGQMCVEAAVCYALGLPHSDDPGCVSKALRALKIKLNDSAWADTDSRAKGMRRLAIAQLGSIDVLDDKEFIERVITLVTYKVMPPTLRAFAEKANHGYKEYKEGLLRAADRCEATGTQSAASEASRVVYDAGFSYTDLIRPYEEGDFIFCGHLVADFVRKISYVIIPKDHIRRDVFLAEFAESIVQILIDMKAPGCQWLYLTEEK